MTAKKIAEEAFKEADAPEMKWQRIKTPSKKTNKRQRLTLDDAHRLSNAIGCEFPDLMWRVWKELLED